MPTHWFGQHSLLRGEPTAQGSVTGSAMCQGSSLPGHWPWAHRGTASSCLLPTHASGQEGLCRMRRYQSTELMCFNSAHSSCGTMTATPAKSVSYHAQLMFPQKPLCWRAAPPLELQGSCRAGYSTWPDEYLNQKLFAVMLRSINIVNLYLTSLNSGKGFI